MYVGQTTPYISGGSKTYYSTKGVSECNKFIAIPWTQSHNLYYSPHSESEWKRLHGLFQSVLRIIPGRKDFCNR